MDKISDWRTKARLVLKSPAGRGAFNGYFLMSLMDRSDCLFLDVMENMCEFLKKNNKEAYREFLYGVEYSYERMLESQAEKAARAAVGDPAALIQFPSSR